MDFEVRDPTYLLYGRARERKDIPDQIRSLKDVEVVFMFLHSTINGY